MSKSLERGHKVRKSFTISIWVFCICFTALVLPFVYAFVKSAISPRELGVGILLLVALLFLAILYRLRSKNIAHNQPQPPSDNDSVRAAAAVRKLRVAVVALPAALILGLWLTRGEALAPRIIGAAMNVLITCWLIFLLRRARMNAK
jgi:hypothetical protein